MAHHFRINVTGSTPDDLEARAIEQLADYLGGEGRVDRARRRMAQTDLDVEAEDHQVGGTTTTYTAWATVELTPVDLSR